MQATLIENGLALLPTGDSFTIFDFGPTIGRLPVRPSAVATFHDVDSFVAYINRFKKPETVIFVAPDTGEFTAIIDYHGETGEDGAGAVGSTQHAAGFQATYSEPFSRFIQLHRKDTAQLDFAEFIEDNRPYFVEPDAATMLEIATTLEGNTKVNWHSATVLQNGDRKLVYSEESEVSAGPTKELEVPAEIKIAAPMFYRGEAKPITLRLRYRARQGSIFFMVIVDQLADLLAEALEQDVAKVAAETNCPVYLGNVKPESTKGPGQSLPGEIYQR